MADPNAKLDPTTQAALIAFIKQRLGLFGAWHLKNFMESCPCQACETFKAILEGGDIPEPPAQ